MTEREVQAWYEEQFRLEESKHGGSWDEEARWQFIQQMTGQAVEKVGRNTKEACLANQQRIMAENTAYEARQSTKLTEG